LKNLEKNIFLKIIMGDPIEKFKKKNFFLKIIMGDTSLITKLHACMQLLRILDFIYFVKTKK
jgi:hypothetical protein